MIKRRDEYLKCIYILNKNNGEVRVTDIANKMKCSKPSVTKQLNNLLNDGLINYETYGKIELTDKGINRAKEILESDDIIYLLLSDVLGIQNEFLHDDATKIKSVISDETLDSIEKYVYVKLGLNKLKCNFNFKSEKCRECIINKNKIGGSND